MGKGGLDMAAIDYGAIVWENGKIITDKENLFTHNEYIYLDNYITFKVDNVLIGFYKNVIKVYDLNGELIDSHFIEYKKHHKNRNIFVGHKKFKIKTNKRANRFTLYFTSSQNHYKALIGFGVDPVMQDYIGSYGITKKEIKNLLNKSK